MNNRARFFELPYQELPLRLFSHFAGKPWSVLLDSGRPASTHGRYDLFSAGPATTLVTRGGETRIEGKEGKHRSNEDPFTLLGQLLRERSRPALPLPFCGGAMGWFAYDLGRRLERLPEVAEADVALPEMAVGIYDWAVITDHQACRSWLVSVLPAREEGELRERLSELLERPEAAPARPFRTLAEPLSNMDRERYGRAFRRIRHYIHEGDCYQVNLAMRFSAPAEGDPWDGYLRLRRLNPAPFAAFIRLPEGQAVLSSSPERFLLLRDGHVETKPIKGTRPRVRDPQLDLLQRQALAESLKDRAENLMIVDLLRNDLSKSCAPGSVKVPELFAIESFATVHHLVSTVTGELEPGLHAVDLLRGCFPGGSITGAPKLRAMEIIEELEPCRRSVYCGSIGYLSDDGAMDTNIAIRTLLLDRGMLHCWAGGGIVMDSDEEREYQECYDKAAALLALYRETCAPGS